MLQLLIGLILSSTVFALPHYDYVNYAVEGDDVLLKCLGQAGTACGWVRTRNDGSSSVIVSSQDGATNDRYSLIDAPENGECSLIIHKVQLDDSALLSCKISPETQSVVVWKLSVERRNPEDKRFHQRIVQEGEPAFMECKGNPGNSCAWTKVVQDGSSSVLVTSGGIFTKEGYVLTDKPQEGDCSLAITKTAVDDSGKLTCYTEMHSEPVILWDLQVVPKSHFLFKQRVHKQHKDAKRGEYVTLECKGDSGRTCVWAKVRADGSSELLVVSDGIFTKERYHLNDSPGSGECSLKINSVIHDDSGTLYCQILPAHEYNAIWELTIGY